MPDMQKLQPCQTSFVLPAELHPPGHVHRVPADCFGAHRGDHNGFNCPGLSLRLRDRVLGPKRCVPRHERPKTLLDGLASPRFGWLCA